MSEPQKERLISPLKLTVAGLASMTAAVAGSFFGDSGTLIGTGIGSIVSGTAAALYEHAAQKAREAARSKLKRPTKEDVFLEEWFKKQPRLIDRIPKKPIAMALTGVAITGATGYGFVAVTEASTGRTLHGITTHARDYGSSFAGSNTTPPALPESPKHHRRRHHHRHATPSPTPSSSPSPTVTPTIIAPTATPTPSLQPTTIPTIPTTTSGSPTCGPTC